MFSYSRGVRRTFSAVTSAAKSFDASWFTARPPTICNRQWTGRLFMMLSIENCICRSRARNSSSTAVWFELIVQGKNVLHRMMKSSKVSVGATALHPADVRCFCMHSLQSSQAKKGLVGQLWGPRAARHCLSVEHALAAMDSSERLAETWGHASREMMVHALK